MVDTNRAFGDQIWEEELFNPIYLSFYVENSILFGFYQSNFDNKSVKNLPRPNNSWDRSSYDKKLGFLLRADEAT